MNVARSHDLPFSCYSSTNMAAFCYGLKVGEAIPLQEALYQQCCALKVVPTLYYVILYALLRGI